MMRVLAGLGGVLALLNTAFPAELYKWTDGQRTYYGDAPPQTRAPVQRLSVDECADVDCERDLERRRQETLAAYRELEEWLDQRAAQRDRAQRRRPIEYRSLVISGPGMVWLSHWPAGNHGPRLHGGPPRRGVRAPARAGPAARPTVARETLVVR